MPTKREREYYAMGYRDGRSGEIRHRDIGPEYDEEYDEVLLRDRYGQVVQSRRKPKRKLSAWNKYVKANSKKPRFRYRNGKLNLKKMAIAFRKTPAGRKKKRR